MVHSKKTIYVVFAVPIGIIQCEGFRDIIEIIERFWRLQVQFIKPIFTNKETLSLVQASFLLKYVHLAVDGRNLAHLGIAITILCALLHHGQQAVHRCDQAQFDPLQENIVVEGDLVRIVKPYCWKDGKRAILLDMAIVEIKCD